MSRRHHSAGHRTGAHREADEVSSWMVSALTAAVLLVGFWVYAFAVLAPTPDPTRIDLTVLPMTTSATASP